jgi:hypothetical protein
MHGMDVHSVGVLNSRLNEHSRNKLLAGKDIRSDIPIHEKIDPFST